MSRYDTYSTSIREEQKAILNGLLGIIYDNYDTTRKIQTTVDGIYKMVLCLLLIVIFLLIAATLVLCFFHCKKVQRERPSPMHPHGSRKPQPIEI